MFSSFITVTLKHVKSPVFTLFFFPLITYIHGNFFSHIHSTLLFCFILRKVFFLLVCFNKLSFSHLNLSVTYIVGFFSSLSKLEKIISSIWTRDFTVTFELYNPKFIYLSYLKLVKRYSITGWIVKKLLFQRLLKIEMFIFRILLWSFFFWFYF